MTTTTSNTAIRKSSILLLATTLVIASSLSPLLAAQMIFAQTNNAGVGSSNSNSSNNTMENMVLNLDTPLFIEHSRTTNITKIDQNISNATIEGNGTFMLPTGTNVSTTHSGYNLVNTTQGFIRVNGQTLIKTIDGKENATIEFTRFSPINLTMGIGIAYIDTNSTIGQQLASLDNTLMLYRIEAISPTQDIVIFWKR